MWLAGRGSVRQPAVSGMFYPSSGLVLREAVHEYLALARARAPWVEKPGRLRALIVPHAGYVYSGPIAASSYVTLEKTSNAIDRVILLGPCHFLPIEGLAVPQVDALETPLGDVKIDREAYELAVSYPQVVVSNEAHASEHSLEVQLPFIQELLPNASILPIAIGDASPGEVAELMENLSELKNSLLIVSSDLSHYLPYESAKKMDQATADQILTLDGPLESERACGAVVINGLLEYASKHALKPFLSDLRNSGDTSGERSRVVGYGAFQFYRTG